jgi:hypothetical protein
LRRAAIRAARALWFRNVTSPSASRSSSTTGTHGIENLKICRFKKNSVLCLMYTQKVEKSSLGFQEFKRYFKIIKIAKQLAIFTNYTAISGKKINHNTDFQDDRPFFRRKLVTIA